jgi:hypothetical protein
MTVRYRSWSPARSGAGSNPSAQRAECTREQPEQHAGVAALPWHRDAALPVIVRLQRDTFVSVTVQALLVWDADNVL